MNFHRGDVVLLAFPFSSGKGGKVRPALIVQCDPNNDRLRNTIVAMITTTTDLAKREPTQLLIDLQTPEGTKSGLMHTSAVKCENVFTVEQTVIRKRIGQLPPTVMQAVDRCLQVALRALKRGIGKIKRSAKTAHVSPSHVAARAGHLSSINSDPGVHTKNSPCDMHGET
jgi:mRNA interferase MazF